MQNEWLKSILGEFQGYINEVKQNAQAQGINADFLDLKEGVLNHRAVVGQEDDIPNDELVTFEKEEFFLSSGTSRLNRYYQALHYNGAYGMECNACCVMYFLQSYGLYPPMMSRKEFEYAFTPLNPSQDVYAKEAKKTPKSQRGLNLNWKKVKNGAVENVPVLLTPKENSFDGIFSSGASNFLRGINGAIFPHISTSETQLKTICDRFYTLGNNNEFLRSHLQDAYYDLSYIGLKNKYQDLVDGIEDSYFEKHVIYAGLALEKYSIEHYCIIVANSPKGLQQIRGTDVFVRYYWVDDPLFGTWQVPILTQVSQENIAKLVGKVSFLYPNAAIGV